MSYNNSEVVVDVRNLSKRYEIYSTPRDRLKQLILPCIYQTANRVGCALGISRHRMACNFYKEFWALRDVTFQVKRGETFGIIGRNGSGKSTLLQIIAGTLTQTEGTVFVIGRIAALLELGSGFNPEFTGRENIFMNGRIHGLTKRQIEDCYDKIIDFADIGEFINQPVKTYSSGMTIRLSFSVAANINPDILIVDEALAVGDAAFQRKCISYMESFSQKGGILLFVSHSIDQVRRLCKRAIYLKNGTAILGEAKKMCDKYETDLFGSNANGNNTCDESEQKVVILYNNKKFRINDDECYELPECAIQYGNGNAKIRRCWTTDAYGNRKTVFSIDEKIIWCFEIVFNAVCKEFFYGLMIKTKEGINLFGTNTLEMGMPLSNANDGDITIVGFEIKSHLGAGEYFLNCSIAQGNTTNPVFLHRIIDAAIITIGASKNGSSGLITMDINCTII